MRALAVFAGVGLAALAASAIPPFGLGGFDPGEPISITAEELEASETDGVRLLAFRRNVEVRQGALELRAERLTARFPKDARQPEWLRAQGAVRIREGDRRAQCDDASYDRRAQRIRCRGNPARLWDGEDRLAAPEVIFDLAGRRVAADGGSEVEVHRSLSEVWRAGGGAGSEAAAEPAEGLDRQAHERLQRGGPVFIRSAGLEAREQDGERRIRFHGAVHVRQGELTLQAAELEAVYSPESREPDRLRARGDVVVAEGAREGRCERADYRPRGRRLTCEGNARLRDGDDELSGRRIVVDFEAGTVQVVGDTRLRVAARARERP